MFRSINRYTSSCLSSPTFLPNFVFLSDNVDRYIRLPYYISIFAFPPNPSRRRFLCGKMSRREPKGKKASDAEVISWKQKKDLADMEEMAVGKQLEELIAWVRTYVPLFPSNSSHDSVSR